MSVIQILLQRAQGPREQAERDGRTDQHDNAAQEVGTRHLSGTHDIAIHEEPEHLGIAEQQQPCRSGNDEGGRERTPLGSQIPEDERQHRGTARAETAGGSLHQVTGAQADATGPRGPEPLGNRTNRISSA